MAGYSGTPLVKKLGIKAGFKICFVNPPKDFQSLLHPLPKDLTIVNRLTSGFDFIQFFTKQRSELEKELKKQMGKIKPNGMIWVSWPKKASKVPTDVDENAIREVALPLGLVDVKVCAVDDTWSGLKLGQL